MENKEKVKKVYQKEKLQSKLENAISLNEDNLENIQKKADRLDYLIKKSGDESAQSIRNRLEKKYQDALKKKEKVDEEWELFIHHFYPLKEKTLQDIESKIELIKKNRFDLEQVGETYRLLPHG